MCPMCGTRNVIPLAVDESIHPTVRESTSKAVKILIFSCEMNHFFMTLDEADRTVDAIATSALYERHRKN